MICSQTCTENLWFTVQYRVSVAQGQITKGDARRPLRRHVTASEAVGQIIACDMQKFKQIHLQG